MILTFDRLQHIILTMFLLCSPFLVSGATDDFIVRTVYGDDSTPPSVPASLVATPVATTQINLSWASSTDNVLLSGYQVFRDGLQIATTTAPNYADVGLVASTTYTYFVTAFDAFDNISASSSPVSTTTLASSTPSVVEEDDEVETVGATYGTLTAPFEIISFEIIPSKDSVIIRYETKGHVRSVVRWGKTSAYEIGSAAERAFSTTHKTTISGLIPGMTYTFIIDAEHGLGRTQVLRMGTFKTLPPDDVFPPQNVGNLAASLEGNDIVLTWNNPPDADFKKVRVQRSGTFYPADTADGHLLYEGDGERARDVGAGIPGTRSYYTVFTYDELGNISSGAVVGITVRDTASNLGAGEAEQPGTTTPVIELVDPIASTENPINLQFDDLEFYQDGELIGLSGNRVPVEGTKSLTVLLPYDRVPEHLKTITVTIGGIGESETFLLRINKERTAYVSILAPLGKEGSFPITVTLYDYQTSQIGYAHGELSSTILYTQTPEVAPGIFKEMMNRLTKETTVMVFGSLFILMMLLVLVRKFLGTKPVGVR